MPSSVQVGSTTVAVYLCPVAGIAFVYVSPQIEQVYVATPSVVQVAEDTVST